MIYYHDVFHCSELVAKIAEIVNRKLRYAKPAYLIVIPDAYCVLFIYSPGGYLDMLDGTGKGIRLEVERLLEKITDGFPKEVEIVPRRIAELKGSRQRLYWNRVSIVGEVPLL